jgi:hypothetical protein
MESGNLVSFYIFSDQSNINTLICSGVANFLAPPDPENKGNILPGNVGK